MELLFDLHDVIYFPHSASLKTLIRPRSARSSKRGERLFALGKIAVIGKVDLKRGLPLRRRRTTRQFMCIESDDLESAILVATLYGVYKRAGKTTRPKPKSQTSRSTSGKSRGKHLKSDGPVKIVVQQFVR